MTVATGLAWAATVATTWTGACVAPCPDPVQVGPTTVGERSKSGSP